MHYPEIRPQLRSGDLLLCSGTSWFSRLIQAATGSRWSHVGLILRLERLDRLMLLESVESVGVGDVPSVVKTLRSFLLLGSRCVVVAGGGQVSAGTVQV